MSTTTIRQISNLAGIAAIRQTDLHSVTQSMLPALFGMWTKVALKQKFIAGSA